ncbi:DMT family transporter [Helicobacter felis]|uniref:DMT family transporter n=2 Tax=Helicobacter felis TaxID=214 RepID=UPI000CEEFC87|nr:DMT family transporter [Helicobacter felis]
MSAPASSLRLGIFYMALGALGFGLLNALIKMLGSYYSPMEGVFYRSFFMLFFLGLLYYIKPFSFKAHKPGGLGLLISRVFIGQAGMILIFYNIACMPLGTAIAFSQTAPIYAIVIAWLVLHEKVGWKLIVAALLGILGVGLVANPSTSGLTWGLVLSGVLSGVMVSCAYVSLNKLKEYYDGGFVIVVFSVSLTLIGFVGMFVHIPPFASGYHPMRFEGPWWHWDLWLLIGTGLSGALGQCFITKAYMIAPAGLISPVDYSRIFWALIFGMLLGDPHIHMGQLFGMILIVLSGVFIVLESKKAQG